MSKLSNSCLRLLKCCSLGEISTKSGHTEGIGLCIKWHSISSANLTLNCLERTLRNDHKEPSSVTTFDKISLSVKMLKVFGQFLEGLLSIWQIFKPSLAQCYAFG